LVVKACVVCFENWQHHAGTRRVQQVEHANEGGQPVARCTLRGMLAEVWPSIVATQD
jgi:hypothetical protein